MELNEILMKETITVQNLKCGGCAKTITDKLSEIEHISDIKINIEESEIHFNYVNQSDVEVVKNKLSALGYPSIDDDNSVLSKAKSFVSCASGKLKD